jgi:tetratricopeptide (TPR) repeat protein
MKFNTVFFFSLFISLLGQAPKPELTKDFWNNPSFVRSFMGDYGFRSDIEPRVSRSEQNVLGEVIAKAENQLAEAVSYLEKKVDKESSPALDYALGTMYYQLSRLSAAEVCYKKAIVKFPTFLRAHKNLGLVQLNLGKLDQASENLTQAISLGDGDGITYIALGYCHLSLERYLSAENAYRMGILLLPDSKDARNGLVNCFLYTERFPEALALLDELLLKDPQDTFCHRARAEVLQALNKEKKAVVALETLKRMGKLKLSDYMVLGDLYHNLELYDQSLQTYEEAIKDKERLPLRSYVRVARILIGRGSYQDGFSYLEKIEKIFGQGYSDEDEKEIRLLQAEVMRATGKDADARKILTKLVTQYPLEGKAHLILGQLAFKQQEFIEAGIRYERAAQDSKYKTPALLEHARMLVSNQKYQQAIELLEQAQAHEPQKRVEKYLASINNLLISSRIQF